MIKVVNKNVILQEVHSEINEDDKPFFYVPKEAMVGQDKEKLFQIIECDIISSDIKVGDFVVVDFYQPFPKVDERKLFWTKESSIIAKVDKKV